MPYLEENAQIHGLTGQGARFRANCPWTSAVLPVSSLAILDASAMMVMASGCRVYTKHAYYLFFRKGFTVSGLLYDVMDVHCSPHNANNFSRLYQNRTKRNYFYRLLNFISEFVIMSRGFELMFHLCQYR